MSNSHRPLLLKQFDQFIKHRNWDEFAANIKADYAQATLTRILTSSESNELRRAAVLALGAIGTFESNDLMAAALHDSDPIVRRWCEDAMWLVWFRTPDVRHGKWLEKIARYTAEQEFMNAVESATLLIEEAPNLAEAYNQRAIAFCKLSRWEDCIKDCQQAIDLNPHHFGAVAGMGQCFLRQHQIGRAIECFQWALKINPSLNGIAEMIERLKDSGLMDR